ncbi:hypothetical protein [Sphingomonas sp.]|uniref:hypothetical protein n=1 Tax=Sphingomonas sp. TaxID=28214 RepID=UPI0035C7C444
MSMERPASIRRFEQWYLAGIALSLIGWAIDWTWMQERLAADPRTAGFGWMLGVMLVLNVAVSLLLWFLTARRGSVVAKWIVVVLAGLSVARLLVDLPALLEGAMSVVSFAVGAATTLVNVVAAVLLFRADARAWFGEDVTGEVE